MPSLGVGVVLTTWLQTTSFGLISSRTDQDPADGQRVFKRLFADNSSEAELTPFSPDFFYTHAFDARGLHVANGDIHIKFWYGRAGNNVKQLLNALVLAEATGRSKVCMPKAIYGESPIKPIFDLPPGGECLSVAPHPVTEERLRCEQKYYQDTIVEENLFKPICMENLSPEDYRGPMLRYIKPMLTPQAKQACAAEGDGFDGLTVHLRSGDLLEENPAEETQQAKMAPCSFHLSIINEFKFTHVRIITEADQQHPCIKAIVNGVSADTNVIIQSKALHEDACGLMMAHNVLHSSLSTWSMHFGWLLNEKVKNTFWPFPCVVQGFQEERCGEDTMILSSSCRKAFMYDIAGIGDPRAPDEKMRYLTSADRSAVSLHHTECAVCEGGRISF